jgi:hypothetical protein
MQDTIAFSLIETGTRPASLVKLPSLKKFRAPQNGPTQSQERSPELNPFFWTTWL